MRKLVFVLLCLVLVAHAGVKDVKLDVPTRLQWGRTDDVPGFCGETSFQMHGIFWGNWISTEYVYRGAGSLELLIGDDTRNNDVLAAAKLKFLYEVYNLKTKGGHAAFASWVKTHIDMGHLVVFGGYELKEKGKDEYDHIMPIIGYRVDTASPKKVIGFWVASLFDRSHVLINKFTTRQGCTGEATEPSTWCSPSKLSFAMTLKGFADTRKETFRTKLVMPSWYEPDWSEVDKLREKPKDFTIKAVVYGLTVGKKYSILRFSSLATLPTFNFIKGRFTKRVNFTATAATMTFHAFDKISSNSTMMYRTVLNTDLLPTTRPPTTRPPTTRPPPVDEDEE